LGNGFWPKVPSSLCKLRRTSKADVIFNPEEYEWYFEGLKIAPNAEIGPKGVSQDSIYSNMYLRMLTFIKSPIPIITAIIDDPP